MKIAFMGFDTEEKRKVILELLSVFQDDMGLNVYLDERIDAQYDNLGKHFKELRARKRVQRWIDYWFVFIHYFKMNFVSSASIYDAWATARVSVSPWYHERLFAWAFKHIWYDHLFYILPTSSTDAVRERELSVVISYSRVPFHVLSGPTEDKVDQIKVIIGRL